VPETPGTRVIAPATEAYTFAYGGEMRRVPIPIWEGIDRSYPARGPQAADYFFRIPDGERRWIAALEPDGSGLFQTSTDLLRGRKLFLWGMTPGGRRWQEFLSEPERAYLEIQAGLARTQAEHLPMPAHTTWSWLEAYGPIQIDPVASHAADWQLARSAVSRAIELTIPRARLEQEHQDFVSIVQTVPSKDFHTGSGWGALEVRRCRKQGRPSPIPAGLMFGDATLGPEQEGWLSLLESGRYRAKDPEAAVRGTMVGKEWWALLEASVAAGGGDGWLPWYHLGVMRAYHGERAQAIAAFDESLRREKTPWALRSLALLERSRGSRVRSVDLLRQALELRPDLRPLAVECGIALVESGRAREWLEIEPTLPPEARQAGRVRLVTGRAWLEMGELESVSSLLEAPPEIPDMREGEVSLSDLWFSLHERLESRRLHRDLDEAERRSVRRRHPPPREIDFRMAEDT
jgi:hypothetical protein